MFFPTIRLLWKLKKRLLKENFRGALLLTRRKKKSLMCTPDHTSVKGKEKVDELGAQLNYIIYNTEDDNT